MVDQRNFAGNIAYDDLREWLAMAERLGEVRTVKGQPAIAKTGSASAMTVPPATMGASRLGSGLGVEKIPALMRSDADRRPGTPRGRRAESRPSPR